MIFSKQLAQALLVLIFISLFFTQGQAQNFETDEVRQRQGESHKEREQPEEIDLLRIKVEQLQSLVEQQQRTLALMEKRLKEVEEKSACAPCDKQSAGKQKRRPGSK
jgi:hypothetical protein